MRIPTRIFLIAALIAASFACVAQTRGMAWQRARAARHVEAAAPPSGTKVIHDVHYGDAATKTFDVYAPANAHDAPVIFMVHGGGWQRGDKTARSVVENKVAHWVPRGIILVSVDYPMLPATPPLQEARDVALALAAAQRDAPQWGGNPHAFVLMGHSAGAQLVSLISAEPNMATSQGAVPWLGTVALDSAAYDVAAIMRQRHLRLYDEAFGNDPAKWAQVSPTRQLQGKIAPFLGVCSSRRADSCAQARRFADKARGLGARVEVSPEDLSHREINMQLGLPSDYTAKVDAFLASLDPGLAARLR